MNVFYKTLFTTIFISFISFQFIYSQNTIIVPDSVQLDSTKLIPDKDSLQLAAKNFHDFKDLINTNFDGFSDVLHTNASVQVFDFMDLGQPRFVAPLNMFPHQTANFVDGLMRNEYINGLFNTRFVSLDQTDFVRGYNFDHFENRSSAQHQAINIIQRSVEEKEAYTRLKFYEGDFNYTDLDILFAHKYSDNVKIGLAGFNKGYSGWAGLNNSHTGVAYNAYLVYQINKTVKSEFSWRLNHERSGIHKLGQASNFSYLANNNASGLRFIFDADTASQNKVVLGFLFNSSRHKNRSGVDTFRVTQYSDDYRVYLSKDFSTANNKFAANFNVENYTIWGNAFNGGFSDARFSLNISDTYKINQKTWVSSALDVEQLNNLDPILNATISSGFLYAKFFSGFNAFYYKRNPNPVERAILYKTFSGNMNLNPETILGLSMTQRWRPKSYLFFESSLGVNQIEDEIVLTAKSFKNNNSRSWTYVTGSTGVDFWKIKLSAGGHLLSADQTVSANQSFWGQLAYHDYWFNTILIDATAKMNWYAGHDAVDYNPMLNRFYSSSGENDSYSILRFKIVGTVSDAEIFLEMDNPLKTRVEFIKGYYNELHKVRFGVNWVLWD